MSPWQHFPQREECIMATAKIVRCSKCVRITASNEDDVILSVNDLSVHVHWSAACALLLCRCIQCTRYVAIGKHCAVSFRLLKLQFDGNQRNPELEQAVIPVRIRRCWIPKLEPGLSTKIGILVFSKMDSVYSTPQQEFKQKGISCIDIWVLIPGLNLYAMYCISYHVISLFLFIGLEH